MAIPIPDQPLAALGQKLFFDTRFSKDGSISCASCHQPDKAFGDGKPVAEGIGGQQGTRNTPSLLTASFTQDKFWDGRRHSLKEQVLDPFTNPREHGLENPDELLSRFNALQEDYSGLYSAAFDKAVDQASLKDIALALTAYVNHLKPPPSRVDRYLSNQDKSALTQAEQHGLELFHGRAQCASCHTLDNKTNPLTDGKYHFRGVGFGHVKQHIATLAQQAASMAQPERESSLGKDPDMAALGRFMVTLKPADIGKFKTPSLHEVALTAPYMHDGSLPTLEAAVDWELYYQGQATGQPITLSHAERSDLLAFLQALTTPDNGHRPDAPQQPIIQGDSR